MFEDQPNYLNGFVASAGSDGDSEAWNPEGDRAVVSKGRVYKTRGGQTVHIHAERDGYYWGTCFGLDLQYDKYGRRVPVGGEDPFDLVVE